MQSEDIKRITGTQNYYLRLSEPLKFDPVSRAKLNHVFFDECNNQCTIYCQLHLSYSPELADKAILLINSNLDAILKWSTNHGLKLNAKKYTVLHLAAPATLKLVKEGLSGYVMIDKVFCVQSGDVTEVIVKCPDHDIRKTFKMQEKGPVISIKFNPAQNILAVQRTQSCVEFINFHDEKQSKEYIQNCKSKNAKILGFIWMSASEIIYVTDQGVELYQVEPLKNVVKLSKSLAMNVNWFMFCHLSGLLLLSSGTLGNTIQPIYLKQGNLHKLGRFEIETYGPPRSQKLSLEERDAVVGTIYSQPRLLVLRHQTPQSNQGAEVIIYTVKKMSTVKKTNILKLGRNGRFALSIVDNLIFVHHQASKTSLMFDIGLEAEFDGSVYYHSPVMPPQPIQADSPTTELYSSNWITFPMNVVIDIKIGYLWHLELELEHIHTLVHSKSFLVDFLMLRSNSKEIILKILREETQKTDLDLEELALVFDKMNAVYRNHLLASVKWQLGSPVSGSGISAGADPAATASDTPAISRVVVEQSDMYSCVLSKLADRLSEKSTPRERKATTWLLLEYIRSLTDHQIPVQHYLHELIINSLVLHKAYYQLHQLLQYFVVSDSKPLACLLLSLENLYPAAHQLALDMLQRLPNADQEITEVLLSKQQILPALRYAIQTGTEDQLSERKFKELAQATGDRQQFYAVAAYFEARNTNAVLNGAVTPFR